MARSHTTCHETKPSDELIADARDALVAAGGKWTSMRETVFAELARHSRPASAYTIADNISKSRGRRVAANSIYRILDLFVTHGLALRIESANAFLASNHPGDGHDCIFLVCDECGEASHVDDIGVSKAMRALAEGHDFKAERPVMEIRGLCRDCA
ncbi:MAG: transcriptional repressor [Pseudomonadota bacterium]